MQRNTYIPGRLTVGHRISVQKFCKARSIIPTMPVACLVLLSFMIQDCSAKPGGHFSVAHYCESNMNILRFGPVSLNIGGTGFAALNNPPEVNQALLAPTADLHWEVNQCYVRHPTLGLIQVILKDAPESPLHFQADNPLGPLFPGSLTTDLFFNYNFLDLGISVHNNDPITLRGHSVNPDPTSFNPVGTYALDQPVPLYNDSGLFVGTLDTADIDVFPHRGLEITRVSSDVSGNDVSVLWRIDNKLDHSQEIIWYGDDSYRLHLVSSQRSDPLIIGNQPIFVTQHALLTGQLDRYSCLFLGVNSLSPTESNFTSSFGMVDGELLLVPEPSILTFFGIGFLCLFVNAWLGRKNAY